MKYGSGLALTAPRDSSQVKDLAQTLEGEGFDYLTVGGHVLGAPEGRYEGRPVFTYVGPFHDPFVLYAYLSGVTQRLHFMSGILILPMFPTALVAKQVAELQYVSGGRFEMGVGVSWSQDEYEAMGANLGNRGRRMEEQLELLRRFWKEPFVDFEGKYHRINNLGLNRGPIDVQVWFGAGTEEVTLRRMARLADGWMPQADPTEPMKKIRQYMQEAGRDPSSFRLMGRVALGPEGPESWIAAARHLEAAGATHLTLAAAPGTPPAESLALLSQGRKAISEALG